MNKVDPTALRTLRENYFPGIWKDKAPTLGGTLSKRPLEGSKSFLKPKVFDDWEEAIKAGFEPVSDNPIVLAKMKIAEMDKYILAHTVLNEGKQAGLVSFLRSGDKMPDGWTRINDPIGTVYGPPNIAVKEYIDKRVYDSLLGVANSLGIKHERLPNAGRGKIGYSVQGANKIVTQHATETSVLAHEIGHQLDVKYDLWGNLLKRDSGKGFQPGRSELSAIADLTERGQKARTRPEKIAQVIEAYVHSPEEMEQVAPRVFTWFDKSVKETPELKPLSEIKPGIALKTLETNIPTGGFPVVGNYIAPEEAAQVVNNYISQPLSSSKYFGSLYRGYMNAAGLLNQFQLTGPFHGGFTTTESIISRQALAAKQLYRVFTGKEDPATFLKTALTSPAAFIEKSLKGKKIQQEWLKPGTHPEYGQTVEDMHLAGGGIRRDEFLRADSLKQFLEAVREGKPGTAIWKSPGAATELMAKPIMEWYVPKLKMGAFEELATEYRKVFPNLTEQEYGRAMRQIWNRVDSRLGQVLYDRTFMNNAAKQVVQGSIRAPGWSGGTIAEIGGAPKDAVNFFRQWAKEGKPPRELPDRVAYVISLAATTAVTNGALTYLLTGDMPKGTDFMAFRTGVTTPDGNPERGMLPTYSKDVYAYKQSPIRTLAHKTNPLIGLGLDISRNKDYYGVQVYNPEGTVGEKIGGVGKYILKAFTPFFLRGIQKNLEEKSDIPRALLPLVGVMPAPSHLTQTSAQQKAGEIISEYMPQRARTQEEFERNKLVKQHSHDIKKAIQKKQPIREYVSKIAADLKAGKLNDKDIEKIEERIGTVPLERNVTRMKLQDALRVWDVASLEEKKKLKQIILDKVDRFDGTEEEVKALVPKIKAVINQ